MGKGKKNSKNPGHVGFGRTKAQKEKIERDVRSREIKDSDFQVSARVVTRPQAPPYCSKSKKPGWGVRVMPKEESAIAGLRQMYPTVLGRHSLEHICFWYKIRYSGPRHKKGNLSHPVYVGGNEIGKLVIPVEQLLRDIERYYVSPPINWRNMDQRTRISYTLSVREYLCFSAARDVEPAFSRIVSDIGALVEEEDGRVFVRGKASAIREDVEEVATLRSRVFARDVKTWEQRGYFKELATFVRGLQLETPLRVVRNLFVHRHAKFVEKYGHAPALMPVDELLYVMSIWVGVRDFDGLVWCPHAWRESTGIQDAAFRSISLDLAVFDDVAKKYSAKFKRPFRFPHKSDYDWFAGSFPRVNDPTVLQVPGSHVGGSQLNGNNGSWTNTDDVERVGMDAGNFPLRVLTSAISDELRFADESPWAMWLAVNPGSSTIDLRDEYGAVPINISVVNGNLVADSSGESVVLDNGFERRVLELPEFFRSTFPEAPQIDIGIEDDLIVAVGGGRRGAAINPNPPSARLPRGWEARRNGDGIEYYFDHNTGITHRGLPSRVLAYDEVSDGNDFTVNGGLRPADDGNDDATEVNSISEHRIVILRRSDSADSDITLPAEIQTNDFHVVDRRPRWAFQAVIDHIEHPVLPLEQGFDYEECRENVVACCLGVAGIFQSVFEFFRGNWEEDEIPRGAVKIPVMVEDPPCCSAWRQHCAGTREVGPDDPYNQVVPVVRYTNYGLWTTYAGFNAYRVGRIHVNEGDELFRLYGSVRTFTKTVRQRMYYDLTKMLEASRMDAVTERTNYRAFIDDRIDNTVDYVVARLTIRYIKCASQFKEGSEVTRVPFG